MKEKNLAFIGAWYLWVCATWCRSKCKSRSSGFKGGFLGWLPGIGRGGSCAKSHWIHLIPSNCSQENENELIIYSPLFPMEVFESTKHFWSFRADFVAAESKTIKVTGDHVCKRNKQRGKKHEMPPVMSSKCPQPQTIKLDSKLRHLRHVFSLNAGYRALGREPPMWYAPWEDIRGHKVKNMV